MNFLTLFAIIMKIIIITFDILFESNKKMKYSASPLRKLTSNIHLFVYTCCPPAKELNSKHIKYIKNSLSIRKKINTKLEKYVFNISRKSSNKKEGKQRQKSTNTQHIVSCFKKSSTEVERKSFLYLIVEGEK